MDKDTLTYIPEETRQALSGTFKGFGRVKDWEEIFYDLCFCIMAPGITFKNNVMAITNLRRHYFYRVGLSPDFLEEIIRPTRFYRNKAGYLMEAKKNFLRILTVVNGEEKGEVKRAWLVENIKGLGMKTASHFLRNLGNTDLAIIDTHIIKFMKCEPPKSKKEYLKVEKDFQKKAKELGVTSAELDAVIWQYYSGTPWENFVY